MSEVTQGALISGLSFLTGAIITLIGSLVLEKRRELASYRVNLYAKRLAVHQQAFEWTQKLAAIMSKDPSQDGDARVMELNRQSLAVRDWWNSNALYLDAVSSGELAHLLPLCQDWAERKANTEEVSQRIDRTLNAIVKGIGLKHIDTTHIGDDLRRRREELDVR